MTSAFWEMINKLIQEQGTAPMALVVVEHPIAGHNMEGIRQKADAAFPKILEAAIQWQPAAK